MFPCILLASEYAMGNGFMRILMGFSFLKWSCLFETFCIFRLSRSKCLLSNALLYVFRCCFGYMRMIYIPNLCILQLQPTSNLRVETSLKVLLFSDSSVVFMIYTLFRLRKSSSVICLGKFYKCICIEHISVT